MGGGDGGPSGAEKRLQKEQAELLQVQRGLLEQQVQQQEALQPLLFEQMGLKPEFNNAGEIVGFQRDPQQMEIEQLLRDRQEAALKGELPVDSGLMRDLADREELLRERLRKQFGPGAEGSTPAMRALSEFEQARASTIDAASRGNMVQSQQMLQSLTQGNIGSASAVNTGGQVGGFGQLQQSLGGVLGQMRQSRQFQEQQQAQQEAGIGALAGTGATIGANWGPWGAVIGGIGGAGVGYATQ